MRWISNRPGFRVCTLAVASMGLTAAAWAQNDLVGVLKKKYVVTQTTLNRSQITSPGTVVDVQANGISAEPWDTLITFDNPVVDGTVQQHSKFLDIARSKNRMLLKPGDKVYVTKIEGITSGKNDTVKFSVLSCDALDIDGGASQKRYVATISFRLPKGGLQQTSPDEAERMIDAVLGQDNGDQGGGATAPASAVAAAPAPPPPPPPPQPRAAAPVATETIAMGQTIGQVVGIMGQPQQIIDLGAKKRYKYKDLTVVFVNGKVSDVQ